MSINLMLEGADRMCFPCNRTSANDSLSASAEEIAKNQFDKVVLLGKRTHQYTYPILKNKLPSNRLASFVQAGEVLDYLQKEITGGETILFKGALGLEGVIDQLLADPNDSKQLVRRGAAWDKRRKSWGLPK